jgi:hypothetical protein
MLLLIDHLGSTSVTAAYNGDTSSIRWFKAFGELRHQSGTLLTNYLYRASTLEGHRAALRTRDRAVRLWT